MSESGNKPKVAAETRKGLAWKLIVVNLLSGGLEACIATGTIYIPPLLLQAGMQERYMTMVLALSPVLGLIFVPMIGSASDLWQGRFGRRRPFIWTLSLGVLLSLQIIPQAGQLAGRTTQEDPRWLEVALLTGGVCVLDFCGHTCMTVMVALLSDLFPGEADNCRAFSVNSLMTSLGGCLGFLLPAVDWSQIPAATHLGGQEAFVCALLTLLFLGCLVSTAFIREEPGTRKAAAHGALRSCRISPHCFLGALRRCASLAKCASALPRALAAVAGVPAVIWRLFVAETCCWMAMMSIMLFFADYMGEGLYKGLPGAEPESLERRRYDEGVRMASLGLFLQCVVSVLCSTLMDSWISLLGSRAVYVSGIALMAFATAIMSLSESVVTVTVGVAATGYSLCVLQVVPYTLLCLYQSDKQAFFTPSRPRPPLLSGGAGTEPDGGAESGEESPSDSLLAGAADKGDADASSSQTGVCFDVAILDSAYLLSQLLPALCLGSIVQLTHSVWAYMASACCCSLLAFLCSTRVVYSRRDL